MARIITHFLTVLVLALITGAEPGHAQNVQDAQDAPATFEERVADWNETAERAEEALRNARASNDALEILRSDVAATRSEALEVIERGNIETLTLQARLEALGPPPAEKGAEPERIATQRKALLEAIAIADAPVLAARQAHNRAEVLVEEIDDLIRARQRAELLAREPSPLVPAYWLPTLTELSAYLGRVLDEVGDIVSSPTQGALLRQRLPLAALLSGIGLIVLLFVHPRAIRRVEAAAAGASSGLRKRGYAGLALALRLVLPAAGGGLLALAFLSLRLTPPSAKSINAVVLMLTLFLVTAYWLAHVVFAPSGPERRLVDLNDQAATRATWVALALGLVLVFEAILEAMERDFQFAPGSRSVMAAIIVIAGSLLLWRLASLLRTPAETPAEAGPAQPADDETAISVTGLIARTLQLAAMLAILFSIAGYVQIARQAIVPMVLSLALLAFCLALHHLLTSAVTRFLGGHQPDERVAVTLLPFAIGLLVLVVSLPVFALIWGARLADISEVWILLTQGVEIAGINVSIGVVVTLVAVFVLGVFITRWLQRFLGTTVLPRTKLDSGGRNAVLTGLGYAGITLAALIAVSAAGLDLSNLAIVAGALSVGIGFGMQAIVSNFVSGIILLVERPIKEGDWIEVSGHSGIVRKIAVRSTRIQTFDRHDVIVPNSDLIAGTVKNMTLTSPTGRVIVPVGVAYGSDLEKTRQILLDAVRDNDMVLSFPEPSVLFMGLGESSLDFELRCFLKDVSNVLTARSDLLFTIYTELNKAGIEIPFPQRDITVRNVEDFARALCRPHTETDTGEPAEETPRTPGS
ncbi:MAG: DUF3772 domain-containing protein [Nitratireductor sp.]